MRRTRLGIAIALALLLPLTALAGGWAVVTLDSTPSAVEAGKAFTVGFTVLQHGKTPVEGLTPIVRFSRAAAARTPGLAKGETHSFTARPEGKIGHYVATIELPAQGIWNWEIDAFGPPAPMSAITVAAPALAPDAAQQAAPAAADTTAAQTNTAAGTTAQSAPVPLATWLLAGALGLAVVGAALFVLRPRRSTARV